MFVCERCGKGLQVGMNVSHSHRRTKKRSLPNLHTTSIIIGGRKVKARYCTKCLRIIRATHPLGNQGSVQVTIEENAPKEKIAVEVKEAPTPSEQSKKASSQSLSIDRS